MLDDLRELLREEPFVPFRLILARGDRYDVHSPYQVAIGQTQVHYYFPRSDKRASIRQSHLVALETLASNGKTSRRSKR